MIFEFISVISKKCNQDEGMTQNMLYLSKEIKFLC